MAVSRVARTNKDAAEATSSRRALIFATVVYFVIHTFVPFGSTLLYPLTLLATWVHEMGHGITALVVGGSFSSLDVFANGSGLAYTATSGGYKSGLVSMGGLIAPPIVGAILLSVSRGPRRARIVLGVMTFAIVVSLVVWVRSLAGWIALPLDAVVLGAFTIWGGPRERMVFAQFVGVALAIDTWAGKGYLFAQAALVDGVERPSDIITVAKSLGGSAFLWGALLLVVSLAFLALGLHMAWRKAR
jgi:Peptidase M50B-like